MIAYFSQEEDIGDRPNVTNFVNIEKVCPNNAFKVHIGGGKGGGLSLVLK
jgi:hypothetical protein